LDCFPLDLLLRQGLAKSKSEIVTQTDVRQLFVLEVFDSLGRLSGFGIAVTQLADIIGAPTVNLA
jgi:hypothetical protein